MKIPPLFYAAVGAAAFHAVMTLAQRSRHSADTGAGAAPAPTDPRDFSPPAGPAFGRSLEVDDPESAT